MPRSGELHVTKECSEYKGLAGDFCTITSSNLEEIEVGSKVVYADSGMYWVNSGRPARFWCGNRSAPWQAPGR